MNEGESTDSCAQESGDKPPLSAPKKSQQQQQQQQQQQSASVRPLMSLFSPPMSAEEAENNVEMFMSQNENTVKRVNTNRPEAKEKDGLPDVVPDNIIDSIHFRSVTPTDLPVCKTLLMQTRHGKQFSSSALTQKLQYRQHHAAQYFRCAVLWDAEDATASFTRGGMAIGLVMATRSSFIPNGPNFENVHDAAGKVLIVHAFCVDRKYQKKGIGQRMLADYVESIKKMRLRQGIDKLVMRVHETWLLIWLVQKLRFSVQKYCPEEVGGYYLCELNLNLPGTEDSKRKGLPYWVIDSFAHLRAGTGHAIRGSGNPAAVVLVDKVKNGFDPNDQETVHWMKTVASEFQHSETAFIWRRKPDHNNLDETNNKNQVVTNNNSADLSSSPVLYNIRFYTKDGTEVALCGHATLAASSALYQLLISKHADAQQHRQMNATQQTSNISKLKLSFITKHNVILTTTLAKKEKNTGGNNTGSAASNSSVNPNKPIKISMEFPTVNVQSITDETDRMAVYAMIRDAFNIPEDNLNASVIFMGLQAQTAAAEDTDLLIELSTTAFLNITGPINYQALCQWNGYGRGVIICCLAPKDMSLGSGGNAETSSNCSTASYGSMCSSTFLNIGGTNTSFDFFSRFFGPKVGIEEDPVTGSAHCLLAPYFCDKLEKNKVIGRQMSSRGGTVECSILRKSTYRNSDDSQENSTINETDDCVEETTSVVISGVAVTTMRGTLNIS